MIITKDFIFKGQTPKGGWLKDQFTILGVNYPPTKGWIDMVQGNTISKEDAKRFLMLSTKGQISMFS